MSPQPLRAVLTGAERVAQSPGKPASRLEVPPLFQTSRDQVPVIEPSLVCPRQVPEVSHEEVSQKAQCARLVASHCFQQGPLVRAAPPSPPLSPPSSILSHHEVKHHFATNVSRWCLGGSCSVAACCSPDASGQVMLCGRRLPRHVYSASVQSAACVFQRLHNFQWSTRSPPARSVYELRYFNIAEGGEDEED